MCFMIDTVLAGVSMLWDLRVGHINGLVHKYCMSTFTVFEKDRFKRAMVGT